MIYKAWNMTISENIEMLARRNIEGKKGCRNLKQKNHNDLQSCLAKWEIQSELLPSITERKGRKEQNKIRSDGKWKPVCLIHWGQK